MQPSVIHKDNDICCGNCGSVLAHNESEVIEPKPISLDLYLLGSAMQKNVSLRLQKTREQCHEENMFRFISNIVKRHNLPDVFITDVFLYVKRKNHLQSEKEAIKQLLKILEKDDNYMHIHKYRQIKKRYEEFFKN